MAPPTQPKRLILVVEDTAEIRDVWRRVLTANGFLVVEAVDGAEGVRKAQQHRFDLILMDLNLPVLDGITAIQQLKAHNTTMHVPVIVVSGDLCAAGRAQAVGAEVFLAKPVRAMELLRAIECVLASEHVTTRQAGLSSAMRGK